VVLNSRSDSTALKETAARIRDAGGEAVTSVGDVADPAYAAGLATVALEAFGRIDILVNNAGVIKDRPLAFMRESDWDEVVDTNLKGAFLCSKSVIKPMVARMPKPR
jgi:3-oxoacyl-[acyl-carrier protein] reductase